MSSEQQAAQWTPPADAVCCEDGCELPVAGTRPSTQPYILEDDAGQPYTAFQAGEVDEVVCAVHAEGEQP